MYQTTNRRHFLRQTAGSALAGVILTSTAQTIAAQTSDTSSKNFKNSRLKKSLILHSFPESLSVADRFKLTAEAGIEGMEIPTTRDPKELEAIQSAAEKTGVKIHSIMNMDHWKYPLSDNNPEIVKKGIEGLKVSQHNAKAVGADTVLLVPGVVKSNVRYQDAYERSQKEIRKILPLARELKIVIAVENVWNRFLLSPLEFARYIDEFNDPYLRAYFDIGNVLGTWGWPQDWILTLGKRIKKLHLKDYHLKKKQFVTIREGSVDWPAVRQAIDQIGYNGYLTLEERYEDEKLARGDASYLRKIADKIDLIIAGK